MGKHKPTQQMFGQIMRQPLAFKKDTKTDIEILDQALDWLSSSVQSVCDLAVAKEGIPLMMVALKIQGAITACHEDQALLESLRQSLRFHRMKQTTFLPKALKGLPTRMKTMHEGYLALDLTTENQVIKALDVAENSSKNGFHMVISFKKSLSSALSEILKDDPILHGEYETAEETYTLHAFTRLNE